MAWFPISGYASTADRDCAGHIVLPSAFTASVAEKGITGPKGVKLLFNHDKSKVLGRITKLQVTNKGLWIEADIQDEISYGKDVALAVDAAGGLSYSVGFYPEEAYFDDDEYPVFTKVELTEVSVVVWPCNEQAVFTSSHTKSTPLTSSMSNISANLAKLKQLTRAS